MALDSTLSNLANFIYCDTNIPIDVADVFFGFILSKNIDDNQIVKMNSALSKIYKSKRYQSRYNDYMEKYYGDQKCGSPVLVYDDVMK